MGGFGSGRHLRKAVVKAELERLPCLCTSTWKRACLLQANQCKKGIWEWRHDVALVQHRHTIAYEIETGETEGVLRLSYRYKDEPVEYNIPLLTRPEPFGGCRWYFGCPIVGHEQRSPYKRATRLYRHGPYFGCAFCLKLVYKSQNENEGLKRLSRRFGVDLQALEGSMAEKPGWFKRCWVGKPLAPSHPYSG